MVLLEDVEDMEDSLGVDCGINKSEVESPGMILIKGFVEVKICPPLDKTNWKKITHYRAELAKV